MGEESGSLVEVEGGQCCTHGAAGTCQWPGSQASWDLPAGAESSEQPVGVLLCPPQAKVFPPVHLPLSHLSPAKNPWWQGPTLGWPGCHPLTQGSQVARQVATKTRQESDRNGEYPGLLVRSWAAGLWAPGTVAPEGARGHGFVLTLTENSFTLGSASLLGPGLCGCLLVRNLDRFTESLLSPCG